MSTLIDASPFGARLRISRPTERGRLLQLIMKMPRHLRCFDHDEEEYRTWAVVRHIQQLPQSNERSPGFEIGVAFIGKRPPATIATDPARRYDIASKPTEHDWWTVRERPILDDVDIRERRDEQRFSIATDVFIEVYDAEGRVYRTEKTRTENISHRGMAVVTDLNLVRGRYLRLRSPHYNIAVIAAVRRLRRGADGKKRLHLEFVDQQWPQLEEE
jgi:PilZ domain-containing protein